jgi:hypothetical protein
MMVELILTLCMSATVCNDYTVDSFSSKQECDSTLSAFIIENNVPATEAQMFSCEDKQ